MKNLSASFSRSTQAANRSSSEQSLLIEDSISPFRLLILASSVFIYFFLKENPPVHHTLVAINVATASIYGLVLYYFRPHHRFPGLISRYFITTTDILLATSLIYATGGFDSPFHLVYYACIVAVAIRHGARATLVAAIACASAYLAVLMIHDQITMNSADVITRVLYIFLIGGITLILMEQIQAQTRELQKANSFLKEEGFIRQRTEDALRRSEEKLRFTLEAARVGTWSWDRTTNKLVCSENLSEVFHLPPNSFTDSIASLHSRVHAEDQSKIASAIVASKEHEGRYSVEFRHHSAGGRIHWIEEKATVVLGPNGLPSYMSGVNSDITARKQIEEGTRVRVLQQGAVSDISRLGLDGERIDLLFSRSVESVRDILGVCRVEIWENLPQGGNRKLRRSSEAPGAEPYLSEDRAGKNRSGRANFSIAVPIPGTAGNYGSLVVNSDEPRQFSQEDAQFLKSIANVLAAAIDRQKLQDELLRRVEELADADKRKDEFLAMLAHELRNPLAPIYNALAVLGHSDPKVAGNAREMIDRQIRHLTRLVDDLLDVSRVTRGKITLKNEDVDLNGIVHRALETCSHLVREKEQFVLLKLSMQPIYVNADSTRLEQVLTNLINNAAKYSDTGAQIIIATECLGDQAILKVIDNGIGMSPEMLGRAFDLFSQADRSLDRARGGLGIGLTLVKRIIELHGGTVTAFSGGLGKGTEMKIVLPGLLATAAQGESAFSPLAAAGSLTTATRPRTSTIENSSDKTNVQVRDHYPLKVLVVDDSPDAAEFLSVLLGIWGHEVDVANDGKKAIDLVVSSAPDVVLLDIGLPGMDGYQVARIIRSTCNLPEITLVALTGYGRSEDRQMALKAGFDHHMVKPIHPDVLKEFLGSISRLKSAPKRVEMPVPAEELTLH